VYPTGRVAKQTLASPQAGILGKEVLCSARLSAAAMATLGSRSRQATQAAKALGDLTLKSLRISGRSLRRRVSRYPAHIASSGRHFWMIAGCQLSFQRTLPARQTVGVRRKRTILPFIGIPTCLLPSGISPAWPFDLELGGAFSRTPYRALPSVMHSHCRDVVPFGARGGIPAGR